MLRNHDHQPDGGPSTDSIVADFGRAVVQKLRAEGGSQEDHLRAPFEQMLTAFAGRLGLTITMIGEARLPDLAVRPDYAVDVEGARVGYIELKKPGDGVPGTWSNPGTRNKDQWAKLQLLPNVLYTDGEQFAQFSFGKLQGKVARLVPPLKRAGEKLHVADSGFAGVITDFLLWKPLQPRTLNELVEVVSKLCRLLRDDVATELTREMNGERPGSRFTSLAADWRHVLFPNLTPDEFPDQYAQTITFALLLARVEGVSFIGRSIGDIARLLGKKHSLMGRALAILTDQSAEDDDGDFCTDDDAEEHSVALTTLLRVLSVVDWSDFPDDSYNMLYEDFLAAYDPTLRRKSGVYYTPASLVSFMTRFVDDILRSRLGKHRGFAEPDVIVVDPAMGTGSFLAEVIESVAGTISAEEGPGAVAPYLRRLSERLIGFENQAAPYAIAELRIHSLLKKRHRAEVPRRQRRFLADTLDDPDTQTLPIYYSHRVLANSRQGANEAKRDQPVMVVIGNPPYVDKVKGSAPWIETRSTSSAVPSLSAFRLAGNARTEYVLSNKYVYFWRWATWKTFDAHPDHPAGVVAFVCSAGFLAGIGFAGMREYLRRTADEGWIVDLTPEGHQPPMNTRFFQGNQQPICVAIFIRRGQPNLEKPAQIFRTAVTGTIDQKVAELKDVELSKPIWQACQTGWTEPLQVPNSNSWTSMPSIVDIFPWTAPGVKPNRTWVYAPDQELLRKRWSSLIAASRADKPTLLKETSSTKIDTERDSIPGMAPHQGPLMNESKECPLLKSLAHRPFDRKWLIPDTRLLHRPSPPLWLTDSTKQIYTVEQHVHPISGGPALLFSSLIPDMDCHSGRGGRVAPLFRDENGTVPNIAPRLLGFLARQLGCRVQPADLIAYLAAVTAHPGYTRKFATELTVPGIRIPLTGDGDLWTEAVRLGREVVWLHTFGERFADDAAGRPAECPRMAVDSPKVQTLIPDSAARMPETMGYDEATRTLLIGDGRIAPVAPEVVSYEVSGMVVLKHWFGYRRKNPAGNRSSPLDDIVATTWDPAMTTELLAVLNILGRCVALEPAQANLLERITAAPLITTSDLTEAAVLPIPAAARKPPKPAAGTLFAE